jgi:hypothetical protein
VDGIDQERRKCGGKLLQWFHIRCGGMLNGWWSDITE